MSQGAYFLDDLQVHGGITEQIAGSVRRPLLDFSSNLNPFGPPDGLQEIISSANIEHYPAGYSSLENSLANFCGCEPDNLLITNGASEAFYFLALFFKPRVTSIQAPCFSEYQNSMQALGSAIREIDGHPDNNFDLERYYRGVEQSDVLFIGNPNNPDGRLFQRPELDKLIKYAEDFDTTVILDEAFIDYCGRSESSLAGTIEKYSNLVIVGSLTKVFAIAGLRFGYIIAGGKLASRLKRARPPWPVSSTTSAAVEFCLSQDAYYKDTIQKTNDYKESFALQLARTGLKIFPSAANYLLAKLPDGYNSHNLAAVLLDRGFLIRDCRSFSLGDQFIRLAVKLPDQNNALVESLQEELQAGRLTKAIDTND